VKVSYVQIYKEQVYDLLNIASFRGGGNAQRSSSAGLRMRWSRNQQFYLENVYKCECKSAHEVLALYQSGINNKVSAVCDAVLRDVNLAWSRVICLNLSADMVYSLAPLCSLWRATK
jgi:hypothetical protein